MWRGIGKKGRLWFMSYRTSHFGNNMYISCDRLQATSISGFVVKTTGCVMLLMYHCGSGPTEVISWFENGWILIIPAREKIRWISCDRRQTTIKWSSGKDHRLCNVPLWFTSYRSHFGSLKWLNTNYTSYRKKYGD